MHRRSRTTVTSALAAATLLAAGLAATAPSSADDGAGDRAGSAERAGVGPAARASLRIKPARSFVGGQRLIWSGNVGARGVRTIKLQTDDERAGDVWTDVEGFRGRTKRNGSFRFAFPAPANFDITYRVLATGGKATPRIRFDYPKLTSQEINLTKAGEVGDEDQETGVVVNRPYTLVVDTTPFLSRRPDTQGIKPIPGRKLTLQTRVDGGSWRTVDTAKADKKGFATFNRPAETQTGTEVYRVRQENWFKGGDRIGWLPSFPLFVRVTNAARAAQEISARRSESTGTRTADRFLAQAPPTGSTTASLKYGWAPALFDFAWTYGESLTSKPGRGSLKRGKWIDYQGGSGRVSHFNDGLGILSKRLNDSGRGDFGTTYATLQGNARAYGRWEVRLRAKTSENAPNNDYNVRLELVPENAPNDQCRTILVTNYQVGNNAFGFGATNGRGSWGDTSALGASQNVAIAFAVEVTRDHITWFREGKPVGTLDNDNAISGAPMTLRMSLVGDGQDAEMNGTDLISDWQRGFDLGRGRQVEAGGPVPSTQGPAAC